MQLIEYWPIILGITAVAITAIVEAVKFYRLPRAEQIEKIKEVLLVWVIEAEEKMGGGTGAVKLRYVYDLFIARFPAVARVVSFETFSTWVDEALDIMEDMIAENKSLAKYVTKE